MRNITAVFACGVTLLLAGCQEVKREYSKPLHEDAVIVEAIYTSSRHDSEVGLTAIKMGPAVGVDYGGNLGFAMGGGLQISSVTVPEKFAVVFKCQHGRQFIISRKEVYEKFKDHKGKTVDVAYREVYQTTYDKKDGKKQVVERALVDYDFLDATLK